MASRRPKFVIILAGGKGTRMRSADRHKVCFPIDGRPAIVRALDVYREAGIEHPIVVVGAMADQVMETVSAEHEGAIYVYQAEQLGTGHAARLGARALAALGHDEEVLLVAGDRLIEPIALERLIDLFYRDDCDLAFMVGPRGPRSEQGRVVLDTGGAVVANVEMRDVRRRQGLARLRARALEDPPPTRAEAREILLDHLEEQRAAVAYGDLWEMVAGDGPEPTAADYDRWIPEGATRFSFPRPGGAPLVMTPDEVGEAERVNVSVYLAKASALTYALEHLSRDNAQHEEYLSDVINLLAQGTRPDGSPYTVRALYVENPRHVLGFNNPAELLEVEAYYRERTRAQAAPALPAGQGFRSIAEWLRALGRPGGLGSSDGLWAELTAAYGEAPEILAERTGSYRALLEHAASVLGEDTPVFLVRAPGRVNILGRHIDHQGGNCNLMAIDREILMAVHPRDDDHFRLHNVEDGAFQTREFAIGELLSRLPWDNWLSLVNSAQLTEMLRAAEGDWSVYVQAAVLRLQIKFGGRVLRGMDMVVHGNIPIGAGLSSSSALVVAAAEATVTANALEVLPSQFVDLCGEGEWYVGTRGGSADHAAVVFGQRGKVAKVRFFPFGVERMVDFPADYRLAICNSLIEARKAAGARNTFNQRIACYRLGAALIRQHYRQYAPLIEHLRDVNARNLGVPLSWIYRIILSLPERATRDDLAHMLPEETLRPILATHEPPAEGYDIRGVVLFGLAECERSRVGVDLLGADRVEEFGRLMRVSHDGDRVARFEPDGSAVPFRAPSSNAYLLDLITALESGDPAQVIPAQLEWQPGGYRCSTPEIDWMVDLALGVPGVAGAQLAGAGLGGCMMVLAHRDAIGDLTRRMAEGYYAPRGLAPAVSVCTPIAGSGVLLNPWRERAGVRA
jgi:N-acetylgalactosamine kinase